MSTRLVPFRPWLSSLILVLGVGCGEDAEDTAEDASTSPGSSGAETGPTTGTATTSGSTNEASTSETTGATTDDPTVDPTSGGANEESGSESSSATGAIDNPCGDIALASEDPFSVDFGDAGSFEFPGGPVPCQFAGTHTGMWTGADGTALSFSGLNPEPLAGDTTTGTVIDLIELRWERSAGLKNGQADRFSAAEGKAMVVEGGPFGLTNAMGPAKLCIFDVAPMNNVNTGETATFPEPFGVACN